ncbi:MAG: protease pro-enzyme activation domain-containing protein [Acidobacteriaceae bacterium]
MSVASGDKLMELDILLPLRHRAQLLELQSRLYDPSSPDYRHFLTPAEFTQEFGPDISDYRLVVAWAKSKGFTIGDQPANRLRVPIKGTVAQVNAAFHVIVRAYHHPTENRTFYAPDREPTVDLTVPLWHIAGMSNYSVPHPLSVVAPDGQQADADGSGPGGTYLPEDMRTAYYAATSLTGAGQCIGLAEFDGYNIADVVDNFYGAASATTNGSNYSLTYDPSSGGSYTIPINNVLVTGGSLTPEAGDIDSAREVALDIAQGIGMAPGISQVRVYIAADAWTTSGDYVFPANTGDEDILSQMVDDWGNGTGCAQLSISWGWNPENPLSDPDNSYFSEMATTGQSLFAASGDHGSWPNSTDFYYPAEEPNLTTVGGTDLTTSGPDGSWESETAWSDSSGGVSPDHFAIPTYQSGLACSGCSTSYRNAPDVAAEANFDNLACSFNSCLDDVGGTSFAAPRWAGVAALANQEAAANGNSSGIGLINPLAYSLTDGSYFANFHDITSGSNGSYSAEYGYDLVTGWGSPNGSTLVSTLALGRAAGGWVSLSGPTQYPDCMNYTATTVTVGGYQVSAQYQTGWTAADMAGVLAEGLNASGSPAVAMSDGSVVYIAARDPGTSGDGMSVTGSGTECLEGPGIHYYSVFTVSTSGSLSGGGGR